MKLKTKQEVNDFEVKLSIDIIVEESGIGGYEFWGFKGYDKGEKYLAIDGISWDKSLYSKEENDMIEKFVDDEEFQEKMIDLAEEDLFNNY